MNPTMRAAGALAAALLALAACSKSSDTGSGSTSATPAPPATAAAPATPSPVPHVAANGGHRPSIGKGTEDDIAASGLPMYPNIAGSDTNVIKGSDQNGKSIAISATTADAFPTVDAWYASKLGADFQPSRLNFGVVHVTTFKKGTPPNISSVILTAAKSPRTGAPIVSIMLLSKSKP